MNNFYKEESNETSFNRKVKNNPVHEVIEKETFEVENKVESVSPKNLYFLLRTAISIYNFINFY